jgi:hypothetical protein
MQGMLTLQELHHKSLQRTHRVPLRHIVSAFLRIQLLLMLTTISLTLFVKKKCSHTIPHNNQLPLEFCYETVSILLESGT